MPEETTAKKPHILALDLTRVVVVALVVGVHTLSIGGGKVSASLGAFIVVFHSSREVFFLLTAFVLTYNYGRRHVEWWSFWKRRYSLVLPAYIAWSVIYFFADGRRLEPISHAASLLGHDLLTATARYQLYFLLVTMQMYLVFPLLRWLVKKTASHHLGLLMVAALYQLGLTVAIQHRLVTTGFIGAWLRNPDSILASYVLYMIAGAIAAWHFDAFVAFTRQHRRTVITAFSAGVGTALVAYFTQLAVAGQSAATASAVFQPAVVLESLAIAWALFAAGLAWVEAGARHRTLVSTGADSSFGIFLAHPLVLQGAIAVATSTGILTTVRKAPPAVELLVLLFIVLPLVYGVSGALAFLIRRTPLSLTLTGRRSASATARTTNTLVAPKASPQPSAPWPVLHHTPQDFELMATADQIATKQEITARRTHA